MYLTIQINNQYIYFNDVERISLKHSNLPVGSFQFSSNEPIFWIVEMRKYDPVVKKLILEVVNYQPTDIDDFLNQQFKNAVQQIEFQSFQWNLLLPFLNIYRKQDWKDLLVIEHIDSSLEIIKPYTVSEHFNYPIRKIDFKMGHVVIRKKFSWTKEALDLKIHNDNLLPEFEHIKGFFSKLLGKKTIEVKVLIEFKNGEPGKTQCYSSEISKIGNNSIETIKYLKTAALRKAPKTIRADKSLFTPDEIFQNYSSKWTNRLISMSQNEILEKVLIWEDIRNKKQLDFLASKIQDSLEKIRFTLTPNFGFLFVHHSDRYTHYIWELLNSHASYIWSFNPSQYDTNLQLRKLEEIISFIRTQGRNAYKNRIRPDDGILFHTIMHRHARSAFIDAFPKWKAKVEECLI